MGKEHKSMQTVQFMKENGKVIARLCFLFCFCFFFFQIPMKMVDATDRANLFLRLCGLRETGKWINSTEEESFLKRTMGKPDETFVIFCSKFYVFFYCLFSSAPGRVLYDGHWKFGRRDGKGYATYADGTK